MPLTLVTAPAAEPVTLAEAKAHLRVTDANSDALIAGLVSAAVSHLDGAGGILGRALVRQTWTLTLADFPGVCGRIVLPLPPLASVGSVTYVDSAGATQTLASSKYQVVVNGTQPGWIRPVHDESWPDVQEDTDEAVTVTFVAGYAPGSGSPVDHAESVPTAAKQAILLLVRHWYDNPSAVVTGTIATELPLSVERLLSPLIVRGF